MRLRKAAKLGWLALVVTLFPLGLGSADARVRKKRPRPPADKAFQQRMAALKKEPLNHFVIKMTVADDPAAIKQMFGGESTVLVASSRTGIYTPEVLSSEDIRSVVNEHLLDVRKCYKKQLEADPDWQDDLILDLAIKKTGRVSEVSVEPRRVRTDVVGMCLMSAVPKWKFPAFTGETSDGVTQEVVNASFPFTLTKP